ncbi:Hypothetical protein SMAX5B_021353 [Scophthalmus maximus]|uniref:Uncharacterized protein n=1 Tax=Scophthalmus maximus TaxID=52904 RepID=A0A2U9BLN0_SCOMX|nr:Hypothetical protein SMAX5B_021353 [Scophthalmus maximus]
MGSRRLRPDYSLQHVTMHSPHLGQMTMPFLPPASSSPQPVTSTIKSHSKSGLVLNHPALYFNRYSVVDSTQKEANGKPRFLSKHHKKGSLNALMAILLV